MKVHIETDPVRDQVRLYVTGSRNWYAQFGSPITWLEAMPGETMEPFLTLPREIWDGLAAEIRGAPTGDQLVDVLQRDVADARATRDRLLDHVLHGTQ